MTATAGPPRMRTWLGQCKVLWLAVPPLACQVLAQALFEIAGFDLVELGRIAADGAAAHQGLGFGFRLQESETRLLWMLALFLNLVSALALTLSACVVLALSVSTRGLRLFLPCGLLLIALGLASLAYAARAQTPLSGIFSFTYGCLVASGLYGEGFLGLVKTLLVALNAFSIVAPIAALMAACSTLAPPRDGGPGDVVFLAAQARRLKAMLILGSVYMVAGVLHMGVWLSWPAVLLGEPALAEALRAHAQAVSLYWGGSSTVLIAAFYAPAMLVLHHRATEALARDPEAAQGLTPETFLERQGLSLSVMKQLPQIAAVLAPLVAGPLGSAVADLAGVLPAPG